MIAGETLSVVYRFRWRTERCVRTASELDPDIRHIVEGRRQSPVSGSEASK
jgi:hypothetical protein